MRVANKKILKNQRYGIIGLILFSSLQTNLSAQEMPPANVNVATAELRSLSPVAWVSGTVVSRNNSQIAAEVSGRLVDLSELGEKVKKGDTIAQIDDTLIELQSREAQANVQNAQSRLSYLESEVKRKSTLAKRNLSTITDLDETISQRDIAKGDLASAKSRLAQIEQQLIYTKLKAPFDGVIAERLRNQGEYVNSGTAIIRLVESDNLEASIFSPLEAYQFLTHTDMLAVESSLGQGMAPIKAIIPVADSRSHLMQVRLDLSNFNWPVGLSLKAAVASGDKKEVIAIPRDALVLRRDGMTVFRVNADNKAEQLQVSVGIGAGELIEVIGDVKKGDKIIIRGAERLRVGQSVFIKPNDDLISGKQ